MRCWAPARLAVITGTGSTVDWCRSLSSEEHAMFEVDTFVAECEAALPEPQPALAIKELLVRAVAQPNEVDAALGAVTKGGMRCLYRSSALTVLQFIWPPGVRLFPHDHRMWAGIGIYGGRENNTFFRRTPNGVEISGGKQLRAGDVALLGDDVIHGVANPSPAYTAAIHVYGGDYFGRKRSQWDLVTLREQPFDAEAVRRLLNEADYAARQNSIQ
jgi:predicted metal-dependent enzyme (double-stranded beta helix superfamily)